MIFPADEAAVAACVVDAYAAREPFLVQGAGTKLGMLRPVQAARTLSVAQLTGVTLYAPKELVLAARAGTPMADIENTLAAEGQFMIAEPPDFSALLGGGVQTFGGVTATNLSGPRRVAWGAMRDHVLGVRLVNGVGEVIRGGGRVLKNVTGLDICKLLTGSHGTLGILTEITVKVLPRPESSGSVVLRGLDARRGVAALSAALGSAFAVSGAAYLPSGAASLLPGHDGASLTLARIEDFAVSVTYRTDRLRILLADFGTAEIWREAESVAAWRAVRNAAVLPAADTDAIWRISVRPSQGPGVLAAAVEAGARGYLDWGGGLVMLAGAATQAMHEAIIYAVRQAGGVWSLLRAPEAFRNVVNVVPPEPPPLAAITRRVKAAMDPAGILNPGRIFAGV
jgi:glycolate oxidase FAD binding subunit